MRRWGVLRSSVTEVGYLIVPSHSGVFGRSSWAKVTLLEDTQLEGIFLIKIFVVVTDREMSEHRNNTKINSKYLWSNKYSG